MPYLERPDGCRLFFELYGEPMAAPLVLLEGSGGDIPGWGSTTELLASSCRVLAFDLRGNGASEMPDVPVTMDDFVDDLFALMDHTGMDQAHLYGQSFGGMVAQVAALTAGPRVRSLILAATHCGGSGVIRSRAKVPKDRPYLALFSESFVGEHPERVAEHQRLAARNLQSPHAARRQWEAIQGFDGCGRLGQLRLPTLVLHGSDDRLIDVANARMLAERISGARLVILEGAGHVYHWEQPEPAAQTVSEFIRGVEADR